MTDRIDKEAFVAAEACLTQGWYLHRAIRGAPSPGLEWRFFVGAQVATIAREQLGAAPMLPRSPVEKAVATTASTLTRAEVSLAYEATFASDHLVARADAVRKNGRTWDLIEVKSGKLPKDMNPERVKSDYIDDIAFTTLVAQNAGLAVERCILILIRPDYRCGMPMGALLGEIDVTDLAMARAREFAAMVPQVSKSLCGDDRPEPALNRACKACDFYETQCIGRGIADPVFLLPGLRGKRFEQLRPYGRISALPEDADLTEPQRRVATVFRTGKPLVEAGLSHIDGVVWPACYLDFESVNPAIPWFANDEPYEQIPFQFSVHVCDSVGHVSAHWEYIAPVDGDWRQALATQLLAKLGDRGSILMYSPFEHRMIRYLARTQLALADQLLALVPRLFDLEPVFKNGYCHAGFRGRTSIKETLPTMVKELSYEELDVRNGSDAAALFALTRVGRYPTRDWDGHRAHLLKYCELDTLAMVRLHQELARVRAEAPEGSDGSAGGPSVGQ